MRDKNSYNQFDDDYLDKLDAKLSTGKEPHKIRPFTIMDKIKVVLRTHLAFDDHECHVLNTFYSSKGKRQETLDLHDISKTTLYRLLERVDELFDNPTSDSQTRDTSRNS